MTPREANLPISDLRRLIWLDESTGELFWRERPESFFRATATRSAAHKAANWNSRYAGKPALSCPDASGHLVGRIFNKLYYAHRVAFAIYHGAWPENSIDHINGAPADNRPMNLRDVTHNENHRNQVRRKNNTSGVTGVNFYRRKRKWSASITVDGRSKHLGYFEQKTEAIKARREAEAEIGFHRNHGRVA